MDAFQVNSPKPEKQGQYTSRKKGYSQLRERAHETSRSKRAQKRERLTPEDERCSLLCKRVGILNSHHFFGQTNSLFCYCVFPLSLI